jgi:hypothetical protein
MSSLFQHPIPEGNSFSLGDRNPPRNVIKDLLHQLLVVFAIGGSHICRAANQQNPLAIIILKLNVGLACPFDNSQLLLCMLLPGFRRPLRLRSCLGLWRRWSRNITGVFSMDGFNQKLGVNTIKF